VTLILVAKCADGLLMAADSQASEAAQPVMRVPSEKILKLTDQIAWASSGSVGTAQQIKVALEEWVQSRGVDTIHRQHITKLRSEILRAMSPVLQEIYQLSIRMPGVEPPTVVVVLAGVTGPNDYSWILEVNMDCTAQQYEDLGFHAIGSGGSMARLAHATLLHYGLKDRPLTEGRVVAYRVMDSVIESIETVGPPIRMWVLEDKQWRELSDEEKTAINVNVGLWKALERESLAEVMGTPVAPESAG
jgi:proteasome beta subunit